MPVRIPVVQTGLEASIEAAAKKAGRNLKINMGGNAKSIEGLSQPLGRITGKADQFTKSMEAANARVLAFGASVGILSSVTRGFQDLIRVTIDVEKSLTSINSILNVSAKELDSFKSTIFSVAKNTEQSFSVVAEAALELSRQGLKAAEVTKRLNDSLILSRLSGLGASEAVAGLTAAINSFNQSGITSAEVLNKLSAAAVSAAVSERDLIEGIKRSGSVATQAGVSFDELVGVITAVQAKTARGGAVIGNSFKTIFTRIQSIDKLRTMQNLGVEVTDASGQILGATKLIQNLAKSLEEVPDARRLQIAEGLVGKFQVAPFLAILDDYISKTSKAVSVTEVSQNATSEAYDRNEAQNATLSAAINKTTVSVTQLAEALGKIGITDNLKSLLGFFSTVVDEIQEIFDGDGVGSKFAKGIVAGIGNIITGPAFAVFAAVIGKLVIDLVRFGAGSLKTFFGLNKAAKEQATLQGQIASTLLGNSNIQKKILSIENSTLSVAQKRAAQTAFFTTALNEQVAIMTRMQGIAAKIAPGVMAGTRGKGRAAGGFIPNYNAIVGYGSERADISKGVGGAPSSARPVTIPNFNFGGGQKGTMVANSSEYIVPNYAGGDGSAIFNQDMAASIGLPVGARKIGAAGGYIPNFAKTALGSFRGTYNLDKINPSNKAVFFNQDGSPKTDKVKNVLDKHPNSPEAKALMAVRGKIYNANTPQKSVMLIPQEAPFQPSAANHRFQKPYKGFNQFLGGVAGINPALNEKNSKFAKLLKLDSILDDSLADAVNVSLNKAIGQGAGSLKAKPKSYSAKEIKNLVLAEGGAGAFGAMRGAMFEGIMKAITGGVSQGNEGKLDAVFDSNRKVIEEVFGLENQNFEFGDFKNSALSKDKYARQIITNVPKAAAAGYIPNYAGGLQDAIGREKAAGLPINQIRVNQDPKLRNSGNPMGLAITNTRDEPTGAIPNFAKKGSTEGASSAMGDFTTKLFGVQIGLSALGGLLGEVTEKNKLVSASLTLLNVAITAAMASSAFGGLKGIGGILGGSKGRALGKRGADIMNSGRIQRTGMVGKVPIMGGAQPIRGGLTMAGGALTKFGGLLLRAAGPVGAIAAVGLGLNKMFNNLNGTTGNLENQQKLLAISAKNAARELSELKIEDKEAFKEDNVGITNFFKSRIEKLDFEGSEDKTQKANMVQLINDALDSGATQRSIETIVAKMESAAKEEGSKPDQVVDSPFGQVILPAADILMNDIVRSSNEAIKDIGSLDFSGIQDDFIKSITREEQLGLFNKDPKILESVKKRALDNPNLTQDAIKGAIKEGTSLGGIVKEDIEQIRGDEAKIRLSTEISLMKLRAEALTSDQKSLSFAKRHNSLGSVGLLQLQNRIDLAKQDVSTNSSIADEIQKQVDANEQITLSLDEVNFLTETFKSSSLEILSDENKRRDLLNKTLATLGKSTKEIEAMTGLNDANIAKLVREGKQRKSNLSTTQQQAILDARRAEVIENITRDLNRATFREETGQTDATRTAQRDLDRRRSLFDINNPFATDRQTASAEEGFVKEQAKINIEEKENQVVNNTKSSLVDLIKEMPSFTGEIEELVKKIKGIGDIGLAQEFLKGVGSLKIQDESPKPNLFGMAPIGQPPESIALPTVTSPQADLVAKKAAELEREKLGLAGTEEDERVNIDLAGKRKGAAGQIKFFSQLLEEFTDNLRQQAEDLKLATLTAASGSSMIDITDQMIDKNLRSRAGENPVAQVEVTRKSAMRKLQAEAFLAPTRAGRRNKEGEMGILNEQFKVQAELVAMLNDEEPPLDLIIKKREELLSLEKQRLEINDSLGAKLENEFILSNKDIQDRLNDSLVSNARQFVDTITDGMANAIAQGENLGDVLKQAAASFFLEQSKSNFKAGLSKAFQAFQFLPSMQQQGSYNAGGKVTGGSGTRDDVPALLTGGEFVMRKSSVQKYGSGFMNSLNSGTIPAMARGGLFTPGTYGQREIKGTQNLLDFATQSFTTGASDKFNSGSGFASIGLEPQSAALTMFGRRNSPAFQREQASKQRAFGLFTRQVEQERAAKESRKSFSSMLKNRLTDFGIGTLFNSVMNAATMGTGNRAMPLNENGTDMSFSQRFKMQFNNLTDVFGSADISKASEGLNISSLRSASQRPTSSSYGAGILQGGSFSPEDRGLPYGEGTAGFSMLPALRKRATGGSIPYAAGVDTIPSMLSGGEFVMNAAATQRIGRGNLDALNSGGGGGSGDVVSKLDELISVSDNSGETVINITVNSDGSSNSEGSGDDQQNSLAMKIKDVVKQVIDDEKRLGGSLRQARA